MNSTIMCVNYVTSLDRHLRETSTPVMHLKINFSLRSMFTHHSCVAYYNIESPHILT